MRHARVVLVVVDVCLMAYWAATAMHLIPLDKAFKDYEAATIKAGQGFAVGETTLSVPPRPPPARPGTGPSSPWTP